MHSPTVAIVFGTRPEAIKIAPVHLELDRRGCKVVLVNSGQHKELIDPILQLFAMSPEYNLEAMRSGQSLHDLTGGLAAKLGTVMSGRRFDYVLVQGDTTTAMMGALAAFYEQIPVGHIEAGLRTNERYSPFPEEINRRVVSALATDHFAPTTMAQANLTREGISPKDILVTGNTVIDALRWVDTTHAAGMQKELATLGVDGSRPYILMTTHRRENLGEPMREVFLAVRDFLRSHPTVSLVLPLHRNPTARAIAIEILSSVPNARLIEAQDYLAFVSLMKHAAFLLTDSGGIQEEAPYFDKRTLVLRDSTERPEAIESGVALLVGTDGARVRSAMESALAEAMSDSPPRLAQLNPFGDGHAAERIADHVLGRYGKA